MTKLPAANFHCFKFQLSFNLNMPQFYAEAFVLIMQS